MKVYMKSLNAVNFNGKEVKELRLNGKTIWNGYPAFSSATYAQIEEVSKSGKASEIYSIGDTRRITFTDGSYVNVVILGFNFDTLSDGSGKAGITIGMIDVASDLQSKYGTYSRWEGSYMRDTKLVEIYNKMPDELKSIIKFVDKKQTGDTITSDKLWLYDLDELGFSSYIQQKGVVYDYFIENLSAEMMGGEYWLRSADSTGIYSQYYVDRYGDEKKANPSNSKYVVFGFCI